MVTLLLVVFSVGVGVGSLLCERLSGHKIEIGLVPFGSIGLTLFGDRPVVGDVRRRAAGDRSARSTSCAIPRTGASSPTSC